MTGNSQSYPPPRETAPETVASSSELRGELALKYEYVGPLGRGGMGRVILARHRQLDELVAIKLLHPESIGSESVSRLLREARATAKIRSPHVVRVRDVGVLPGGDPYIVMEYLRGADLAGFLAKTGPLPVEQAIDFTLQALDALAEAHTLGIIHRDLKPGNLFVTEDREGKPFIKLVDFGLAKRTLGNDSLDLGVTQPGTLVGSPSYMSPEQLVDAEDVDARTDVWAIGACLFELLTGQPPFRAPSMPQLYSAIVHGRIPRAGERAPSIPKELDDVIARCLSRRKFDRYADGGELARALEGVAGASRPESAPNETLKSLAPPRVAPGATSYQPVSSSWMDARAKFRSLGVVRSYTSRVVVAAVVVGAVILLSSWFGRRQDRPEDTSHAAALRAPVATAHPTVSPPPFEVPPPPSAPAPEQAVTPAGKSRGKSVAAASSRTEPSADLAPNVPPASSSLYDQYP